MSYKKMFKEEAKAFFDKTVKDFDADKEEHGGQSKVPNLSKWLDRTRKLFDHIDALAEKWMRSDIEMIQQGSKNSVRYGDPKESAYFALYKDIVHELKQLQKARR